MKTSGLLCHRTLTAPPLSTSSASPTIDSLKFGDPSHPLHLTPATIALWGLTFAATVIAALAASGTWRAETSHQNDLDTITTSTTESASTMPPDLRPAGAPQSVMAEGSPATDAVSQDSSQSARAQLLAAIGALAYTGVHLVSADCSERGCRLEIWSPHASSASTFLRKLPAHVAWASSVRVEIRADAPTGIRSVISLDREPASGS